jgi:hypothetical protein
LILKTFKIKCFKICSAQRLSHLVHWKDLQDLIPQYNWDKLASHNNTDDTKLDPMTYPKLAIEEPDRFLYTYRNNNYFYTIFRHFFVGTCPKHFNNDLARIAQQIWNTMQSKHFITAFLMYINFTEVSRTR